MTQMFSDALAYEVMSPTDIFYIIAKFNKKAIEENQPVLPATLISSSGNSYHGFPLKKEAKGNSNRGLLVQESNFRDTFAMQVIELGNIISIQFDNATLLSGDLSRGGIPPKVPHGADVPGSLALKRTAANVSETFQGAYQTKLEFTNFEAVKELKDPALYQVSVFLEHFPKALEKIASDDLGLQALKALEAIQITLSKDTALEFKQEGNNLTLKIDFSKALPSELVSTLVEKIEGSLTN